MSVRDIIYVIFPLSRCMGLLPYGRKLRCSKFWGIYSVTYGILYLVIVFVGNFDYVSRGEERHDDWITNPYNLLLYLSQVHLQATAVVIHLFTITAKKTELSTMLSYLKEPKIGTSCGLLNPSSFTVVGVIWVIGCYMSWQAVDFSGVTPWYAFVIPMYSDIACLIIVMQYCAIVSVFRLKFARTAAFLKKKGPKHALSLLTHHSTLIQKSKLVNKLYAKQLVAIMALMTLNYIGWAYFSLQSVLNGNPNYLLSTSQLQMALYQLCLLVFLCGCCEVAAKNAESFNTELFRIARENRHLGNEETLMLYVSIKQTINFTACGFFTLGFPLVSSIIGTATTYIVILVQFSLKSTSFLFLHFFEIPLLDLQPNYEHLPST